MKLKIYWTLNEVDEASQQVVEEAYSYGVDEIGSSDMWSYIREVKQYLDMPEDNTAHDRMIRLVLNRYFYELQDTNTARV